VKSGKHNDRMYSSDSRMRRAWWHQSLLAFCKSSDILEIKFYYSNDGRYGCPRIFNNRILVAANCNVEPH
jgi:hypothetical protein